MKIVKKLIIASVVVIVITIAVSLAYMKYEEHQEQADQSIALQCVMPDLELGKKYGLESVNMYYSFLIQSPPRTRSTKDYYQRAYQLITDIDYEITEDDVEIDAFYSWSGAYGTMRTNKYIHLFDYVSAEKSIYQVAAEKYYYKKAQDKLAIHEELIDEVAAGRHDYDKSFIPSFSFDRETLELTDWNTAKSLNSSSIYSCEEIDPAILWKRVRDTESKVYSGDKKI